jgi:hypothetical protein
MKILEPKSFNDVAEYIKLYIEWDSHKTKREKYLELKHYIDYTVTYLWVESDEKLWEYIKIAPQLLYYNKMKHWTKKQKYAKELDLKWYMEKHFKLDTECWYIKNLYKEISNINLTANKE